jgi:hypothetical protein
MLHKASDFSGLLGTGNKMELKEFELRESRLDSSGIDQEPAAGSCDAVMNLLLS